MSDVLHFIFRNFWTWIGSVILLAVLAQWRPINIDKSHDNTYYRDSDD